MAESINVRLLRLEEKLHRVEEKLDALCAVVERGNAKEALSPGTPQATSSANQTKLESSQEASLHAEGQLLLPEDQGASHDKELLSRSILQDGPYVFEPLNASKSEIRLLALHSATDETGTIFCELRSVELDSEQASITARSIDRFKSLPAATKVLEPSGPRYNALSYHWGSPEKVGHVVLNGHRFPVTENLEAALRQLRQIDANVAPQTRWWIDAICINQDDILERNSQVMLMRRIFKKAETVSIWLGEEADDSSLALDTVVKVAHPPKRAPGEVEVQVPALSATEKLRCWKALWALYHRPWFERAWVRQEIALSKSQTVYCGAYSCHFADLKNVTLYLDHIYTQKKYRPLPPSASALKQPPYARLNSIIDVVDKTRMGSRYVEFSDLLMQTRDCLATDLRDKVFSILGMADAEKYRLQPDYRSTVVDVFISATRSAIEASKRVDILSSCQGSESGDLPSWVPDYAAPWKRQPFRGTKYATELDAEVKISDKILNVMGDLIEEVAEVSEQYVHSDEDDNQLESLVTSWKSFIKARTLLFSNQRGPNRTYLTDLSMERSIEKWLKFLSLEDTRFMTYKPTYSPEGKALLDPMMQMRLRPPRGYDSKHLKRLLLDDDFVDELDPLTLLHNYMREYCIGRRLCLTHSGILGLVPSTTQVGDTLVTLLGAHFSSVLRPGKENTYTFVGEACTSRPGRGVPLQAANHVLVLPTCPSYQHQKFEKNRRWFKIV